MLTVSSFGSFLQQFFENEKKLVFKYCPLFFQISEDNTINLGLSDQSSLKTSMSINSDNEFDYSDEFGLIWHKNWLIPNISVYVPADNNSLANENIYAQMFVVKAELTQDDHIFLKDVGIKGDRQKQRVFLQKTVFKNLKFKSTSYQHDGLKFHLLFLLYSHNNLFDNKKTPNHFIKLNEQDKMAFIELHDCKLSSPFYIDSRKITSSRNLSKMFNLFDPLLLEKEMTKRRKERAPDMKIDSDYDGLVNYIVAPNLRRKTNHPFFLALRFPNIVKLWVNKKAFKKKSFNEKLVKILKLIESFSRNSDYFKSRQKKRVIFGRDRELNEDAYLGMTINQPEGVGLPKKVNEYFGLYDDRLITIVLKKIELKGFEKVSDLIQLEKIYIKFYEESKAIRNKGEKFISEITTAINISGGGSQVTIQRKKVHLEEEKKEDIFNKDKDQKIELDEAELINKREKDSNQTFPDAWMFYLKGWLEGRNLSHNGCFPSIFRPYLNNLN